MAGTRSARAGISWFRAKHSVCKKSAQRTSDSSPALVRRRNTLFVFHALRAPNPCWVRSDRNVLRDAVSRVILRFFPGSLDEGYRLSVVPTGLRICI